MAGTVVKAWSLGALALAVTSGVAVAQTMSSGRSLTNFALASNAPAKAGSQAVRIEYSAPAQCPNAAHFASAVLSRSANLRLAQSNESARLVHVEIVDLGGEMVGEANLVDESGATSSLVAVGGCSTIIDKLSQFVVGSKAQGQASSAAQLDSSLPQNPYLNWKGPIAESIPRNPYLRLMNHIGPAVASNPYRGPDPTTPALNPYRW